MTVSTLGSRPVAGRRAGTTAVMGRLTLIAVGVVLLAAVHVRRPATFCLLRATTGIPCPFCGGTTAAVRLGHADLAGAFSASPLALLMLGAWPFLDVVRAPRWWRRRALRWSVIGAVLVAAEVWQLLRFGLIGV